MEDPLAKDCDCVTHIGPHWLHMHLYDRRQLRDLIDDLRRADAFVGAALANHIAMRGAQIYGDLAREMERRGIDAIPGDLIQAMEDYRLEWIARRRQRRRQRAEQEARALAAEYELATGARRREIETEMAAAQGVIRATHPSDRSESDGE